MGSTFSSVIAIPPDLRYLSGIIHQSETTLRSVFCNTPESSHFIGVSLANNNLHIPTSRRPAAGEHH